MKFIKKGIEPQAWRNYRTTEGVEFSAIKELKNALLEEQGHICCYCMSRISFDKMKVEHWKPRVYEEHIFSYENLLAACTGNFCTDFHCDTRKSDDEITINPTDAKQKINEIINYQWSDGALVFPDCYKYDIENILNLNDSVLKANRLAALKAVKNVLSQKTYTKKEVEKQLQKFKEVDKEGKFQPYCMIVVKFLEKKLRQMC